VRRTFRSHWLNHTSCRLMCRSSSTADRGPPPGVCPTQLVLTKLRVSSTCFPPSNHSYECWRTAVYEKIKFFPRLNGLLPDSSGQPLTFVWDSDLDSVEPIIKGLCVHIPRVDVTTLLKALRFLILVSVKRHIPPPRVGYSKQRNTCLE